ncbi:MAG: polyphosphate--glucose phosphotransferase [Phototrophicaceae bacterium]
MELLGIDIGGSGIKGAIVNTETGEFITERHRIPTPDPSTPQSVAEVVADMTHYFNYSGMIGCTFPAIVKNGITLSAANVDKGWIGIDAKALLEEVTGCQICLLNDADAAGIAEFRFGAGKDIPHGVVIVLTFGTGIGSAIFVNGTLVPNTEFGHMELKGIDAELYAADSARKAEALSWKKWARRVTRYLEKLEVLFSPDLFVIGGGVSKKHEKFIPFIEVKTPIVPTTLLNDSGIIGATLAAERELLLDEQRRLIQFQESNASTPSTHQ